MILEITGVHFYHFFTFFFIRIRKFLRSLDLLDFLINLNFLINLGTNVLKVVLFKSDF